MLRRTFIAGVLSAALAPGADAEEIEDGFRNLDQVVLKGPYSITKPIVVPEGRTLTGHGAKLTAAADMPGPTTRQMVRGQSRATVRGLTLNGGGFHAGGILMTDGDWVVEDVTAANCGRAQAFQAIGATSGLFRRPIADQAWHGVELWRCAGVTVEEPNITRMDGGGVWGAGLKGVRVIGGTISDCSDVGLDFEGGEDCEGRGVSVSRCRNGELAFFKNAVEPSVGCHDISFVGCKAVRMPTYDLGGGPRACEPGYGAVDFSSLSPSSTGIVVTECELTVMFGVAYGFHEIAPGCAIDLRGNRVQLGPGSRRVNGMPVGSLVSL